MTREEFGILAKGLKSVYTSNNFLPDSEALTMWYGMLCDLDYKTASAAAQKHMLTSPYPPTISDIRKNALPQVNMGEDEAWSYVFEAIRSSGYNSQEEWKKLPECVQACITPSDLRRMALDEEINLSVESSNFKRTFRAKREQAKEDAMLTAGVRKVLCSFGAAQITNKDA